ncbi:MAG TPA: ATP-binding protein [Blastocatellia bacterium]|nr:ATP-binding protein [Blastocatellia bacterium]
MSNPNGFNDCVLIVGDEPKSARAIERLLAGSGLATAVFNSFEAAHDAMSPDKTSLVIIDLAASRISGPPAQPTDFDSGESLRRQSWASEALSFCRMVRAEQSTADLPILLVSKSQRPQDKVAVLTSGATDYITKPYQRTVLLSRVQVLLRSWRYQREIADRLAELSVLHSVSSALASSLEPEVLVSGALAVLVDKMNAGAGVVYLTEPDTGAVSIAAAEGVLAGESERSGLLELYAKTTPLLNGKPILIEPLPLSAGLTGHLLGEFNGVACAPLGLKDKPAGSICLFSRKGTPFPERRLELISTISKQLSIALDNARLYIETKKSAAQLSFVYNLGNNLMTSLEMDELLGYAVFTVGKSLECDVCAVVVRTSDESRSLASGVYSRSKGKEHTRESDWCDVDRVNRYLDGTRGIPRAPITLRVSERFLYDKRIAAETVAPLMFDEKALGLLICASFAPRTLGEDERRFLGAIAQQLSLAIRTTELFQRTKDTSINLAVEVSHRTREIEEQKRFTEKIIDSLPVSLYVVDRDMRIVAWNRNRELGGRGMSRDEVLGRNVFQVLGRQPRNVLQQEFTDVFRTGEMVRMELESWVDGLKKHWMISKIPMRVDNAEVTHVITVGEDITEQKKMNDAVIHAEKLASIGRLAAGVVHELNNPLATIAACAEALTSRVDDIPDMELERDFAEYLGIIRDESFRCKTINNSLLDFSHQRQVEKMSGDINQIIDQTLQLMKHHPKLGAMRVIKELDSSLAPVLVNEGQMKQIFIALISNAYDAMESGGTLTIRTRWHKSEMDSAVCAEFADTGCGIAASHLPKIFDPFFTTKPLGRGTGLGLSVCYGIVSEHGGRIEVDSAEGVGSTFRVLLPVPPHSTMERTL